MTLKSVMKLSLTSAVTLSLCLVCQTTLAEQSSALSGDQNEFYDTLKSLCGQRYSGAMTYPIDGQDAFKGKQLLAHFEHCDANAIFIGFSVGEDNSRTWQITKESSGLLFKHEHRLKDGTLDEVTNYGGYAHGAGTQLSQSFPADEFTQSLIPEASTNVWNLSLSSDLKTLTYHLERHQKPRFTAILNRVESQAASPNQ